jgi:hypothetical protein
MSYKTCHNCGHDEFHWSFIGWDKISIDSDGAYQRRYTGDYQDSEVTCVQCEAPYEGEEE